MNILLMHQNFPGQYLHLARRLASDKNNRVIGLGNAEKIRNRGQVPGVTTIGYQLPPVSPHSAVPDLKRFEANVRQGRIAARSLENLKNKGFRPDVVAVHPGWGEGLFIQDVFPSVPVVMFCEYYFRANEADMAFDPEFPNGPGKDFSIRLINSAQLVSFAGADACVCPTRWQASRYPLFMKERMHIMHEGIDTGFMSPNRQAVLALRRIDGQGASRIVGGREPGGEENSFVLGSGDKVVTYCVRNLEPYRGIHTFLRSLPAVQAAHPDAHVIIVGGTEVSYSPALANGRTYKDMLLEELRGRLDFSRIHFLGRVPYPDLRTIFQVSSVHVYLTYPFVLSWSMLEAMSCGCLLAASATAPVTEVIEDGWNGLLFDFFDHQALSGLIDQALARPEAFTAVRNAARRTILERYDLDACLARHTDLLHQAASGRFAGNNPL